MINTLYKVWLANKASGINMGWDEFLNIDDDTFNSYWAYRNKK